MRHGDCLFVMARLVPAACTDLGNDPPRPCLIPSWPASSGPSIQARVPRQMARTSRAMTMWERPGPSVKRLILRLFPRYVHPTTVAYRPCTALTHYILWLSSELSAKCAVLIHYATVVIGPVKPRPLWDRWFSLLAGNLAVPI